MDLQGLCVNVKEQQSCAQCPQREKYRLYYPYYYFKLQLSLDTVSVFK